MACNVLYVLISITTKLESLKYLSTLYSSKCPSLDNKCNDYITVTPTLIWPSVPG